MRLSVEPYPVSGITIKQWKDAMGYDKTWHQEFIEECDEREIKINSMICDIIGVQSANLYKISRFSGRASINKDTNIKGYILIVEIIFCSVRSILCLIGYFINNIKSAFISPFTYYPLQPNRNLFLFIYLGSISGSFSYFTL